MKDEYDIENLNPRKKSLFQKIEEAGHDQH